MANMHRNPLPYQDCHMERLRKDGCRNDLHLTSTGVGLHSKLRPRDPPYNDKHYPATGKGLIYRDSPSFPPRNFKQTMNDLLPHGLANSQRPVLNEHYLTTTAQQYGPKVSNLPDYKPAGDLDRVLYIQNFTEQLNERSWRQPLTMRYQRSECQDQYRGLPLLEQDSNKEQCKTKYDCGPQPYHLRQHHTNGPSKRLIPMTHNPQTAGQAYHTIDKQVLRKLDPYCTTTLATHRPFTDKELTGYARKDVPTYWDCEGYPKAWGHGTDSLQLVKNIGNKSMVDTMVFKSEISQQLRPRTGVHVPHSGLNTSTERPLPIKETTVKFNRRQAVRTAPIPISYQTANSTYGTVPHAVELLQKMQKAPLDLTEYGKVCTKTEKVTIPLVQRC